MPLSLAVRALRVYAIAFAIALAAFLLACRAPSQLMRVQCPESGRTYCPAQHQKSDTARGGGR